MIKQDITRALRDSHVKLIGDNLLAVIAIGSVVSLQREIPENDIDYLVVVSSIDSETIKNTASLRNKLERKIGIKMSNTLIDQQAVDRFPKNPRLLDGKASQTLLEASYFPSHWIYRKHGFTYNVPSDKLISEFSKDNYFELYSLLTKTIIRSDIDYKKVAKIVRIMLKMLVQYNHPDHIKTNEDWTLLIPEYSHHLTDIGSIREDDILSELYKVFSLESNNLTS